MLRLSLSLIAVLFWSILVAQSVDAGNGHSLILDKNGHVWASGRNVFGQLGTNSTVNSNVPLRVPGLENIKVISRGYDHSMAIDKAGYLYLWGRNNYGQLGAKTIDDAYSPQRLQNHRDFVAVEGGHWHTVALKSDGSVWAWGHNLFAELGNGTREHSEWPVRVLQTSGGIVSELSDVKSIASVGYHTLALKKDGTVWGWGANSSNQLSENGKDFVVHAFRIAGIPKIKQIAVGWNHSVALDYEGNIWMWGADYPSKNNLKNFPRPTRLKGLPKCIKIACGSWHSLAIDENHQVWGWGKNQYGMLGLGDTIDHSFPVRIPKLNGITEIGGGCFQSIAVNKKGEIFTCGDNPSGQLGIGNQTRTFSPQRMAINADGIIVKSDLYSIKHKNYVKENPFSVVLIVILTLSLVFNVIQWKRRTQKSH